MTLIVSAVGVRGVGGSNRAEIPGFGDACRALHIADDTTNATIAGNAGEVRAAREGSIANVLLSSKTEKLCQMR